MDNHATNWLWNMNLIALHAIPDLLTALVNLCIPIIALYIFKTGQLNRIPSTYPQLWIKGSVFVFFCGLTRLGSFFEVWFGGEFFWLTGTIKSAMTIAGLIFVWSFWRKSNELILIAEVLRKFTNWKD